MGFVAVLDANALFPFYLRDTLLRAAAADFFQARWSDAILNEMTRNLVATGMMDEHRAKRLRDVMERAFPDAMVTGYQRHIPAMKNEQKDRHVAAAAVRAKATVIVTNNLRDFTRLPNGIEAQSPDTFLKDLFHRDSERLVAVLREQAADLKRPPITFEQLLGHLDHVVPGLVAAVRKHHRE